MEKFGFGSKPRMKEVPPGTEAIFRFNGEPEIVETEYGEKYSFPITLISHDSLTSLLEEGPVNMVWESKAMCAKELYNEITNLKDLNKDYAKGLKAAYDNSNWQLTRFDTGAYWLDLA